MTYEVLELGQFAPDRRPCEQLQAGQVGYLICNIKEVKQVHIGDTVSIPGDNAAEGWPGERGFTGEQVTAVWNLSDGCGGDEDHEHQ